ncbi:MAG: hypothetical protein M3P28_01835, partial [Thermoproteota archaeon]|nr:hypothetical protein [Thermoproteota archaeon]
MQVTGHGNYDEILVGLPQEFYRLVQSSSINSDTITNYLNSMRNEITVSANYKKITIKALIYLSKFHQNKKFKSMKKNDILSYLNSKRKDEVSDPMHSWIATYNLYVIILTRFFKWLYHPNSPSKERPKPG